MAEKFDNFCHIFAIYDVCNTDLNTLPKIMAIRGKLELPMSSAESSEL